MREGGFIVLHRQIRSWPLWHFMSAEQRMVWVQILLDANWKDSEAWVGSTRVTVKRGQLIHSENTIARSAGVGRQVVRTTIRKLEVEGALTRVPVVTEPLPSTTDLTRTVHLITVVNYGKYQDVTEDANQASNHEPTKSQPRANQEPTPSEQGEPVEQGELPTTAASAVERKDPRHYPIRQMLARVYAELRGNADLPWGRAQAGALGRFLKTVPKATPEVFEIRWRYALNLQRHPGTADPLVFFKRWADLVPATNTPTVTAPASPQRAFTKGGPVAI